MDTIQVLMENTEAGYHSRIRYSKPGDSVMPERVIEPRRLVEGVDGLLVRSLQIGPERGFRVFCSDRIINVVRDSTPIDADRLRRNLFCSGEVVRFRTSTAEDSADASREYPGDAMKMSASGRAAWTTPWFNAYAGAIRDAVLDLKVTDHEARLVNRVREQLRLTDAQMRSVHAYLLGEELLGFSADGSFDEAEMASIEQLSDCLNELGWSPMI